MLKDNESGCPMKPLNLQAFSLSSFEVNTEKLEHGVFRDIMNEFAQARFSHSGFLSCIYDITGAIRRTLENEFFHKTRT